MQSAILHIKSALSVLYDETELQSVSRMLLSKVTGWNLTGLMINKDTVFSEKQREELDFYLEKLKKGQPVQYVFGETEFCGLPFNVNENVLIPRPETEELVAWIAGEACSAGKILDLGTGSGCIAVSLKHFLPDCHVYACDIDDNALSVAVENSVLNQADVKFFQCNILENYISDFQYDIIVSNPPYIPFSEKNNMEKRVKDFEPSIALFVSDEDPLIFYRKIAESGLNNLKEGGKLFFEIHYDQADACVTMLKKMNYSEIKVEKDISGKDRMIRAVRKF
jgi:release factor glutamine methyltransferase